MSRYRVRSNTGCSHWSDEPCERCDAWRTAPVCAPATQTFTDITLEHMYDPWETPRPISSREELRQECIKRDVTSQYLRDSMLFRSGPTRWI